MYRTVQSHELCLPAAGAEDGHVNNAGKTKFRARRLGLCFFAWCKPYSHATPKASGLTAHARPSAG